jgi:hypothetical protein
MTRAKLAWRPMLLAVMLACSPVARACGYHDPSSINLGMLNWSYPDSLHVRTAVWMAQRDGALARADQPAERDPAMATIGAMLRLRETTLKLSAWRDRASATLDGRPVPSFSIVLIGTMLWARFEQAGGKLEVTPHADGPASDDVVIVTDEPVLSALLESRITPQAARERGLIRLYGAPRNIEDVASLLDRMAPSGAGAMPLYSPSQSREES